MTNLVRDTKTPLLRCADVGSGAEQPHGPVAAHDINRSGSCTQPDSPVAPFVFCLDRVPVTPASLARIHARVEEINRQFQQAEVPYQLRMICGSASRPPSEAAGNSQ